jgi:hypothetical protein
LHVRSAHGAEGGLAAGTAKLADEALRISRHRRRTAEPRAERIATATAADEVFANSSETDA